MTQIVTTPDGVEHEFPDETSDEVIKNTLKTYSAQTDATAESNAAAGLGDTGVSGADLLGAGKSFVRGVGRGLANIPEPSDVVTGITNIPKWLSNDYNAKIHPAVAGPEGWNSPPPLPVELNKNPLHLGVSENYNKDVPVDPEHPFADVVGQVAGPAIVEGVATGGASIPGQVAGAGRALVTTTGSLIGGESGGAIDRALGGSGEIGSVIGGGLGGGLVPGLTKQAGWKGLSTLFTDADSPSRLAVARIAGVPPSLGLVGNKFAAGLEDATVAQPFAGGPAYEARRAQYEALDRAAQEVAARTRGGPSVGDINQTTTGQGVRDAAATADKAAVAAQNAVMDPLYEQAGRYLPIDQTTQLDQMDTIRRGSQPQYRAPVQTEIDNVNASRFDPENAPKVVDPGLEAQLQMRLSQAQRRLQGARTSGDAQAAQSDIDSVSQELNRNRGQTLQEAVESRSFTGKKIDGQVPLTARQTIATKQAQTGAIKNAAELAGVPPEDFDAANREYGLIAGQRRKLIQPLTEDKTAGQGEAYNKLFSGTARKNVDRVNALDRFAPDETRGLMADELEMRLRGAGAGRAPNPETIGPTIKTAPDWWNQSIPEETRSIMRGPASPERVQLPALLETMRADARRPTRTIPGAGGNTLGLGSIFGNLGTGGAAALGTLAGGPIGGAVTAAAIPAAAWTTGKAFTNPNFVNRVVNPGPWFNDPNSLSRIMAAAYGGGQSNQ